MSLAMSDTTDVQMHHSDWEAPCHSQGLPKDKGMDKMVIHQRREMPLTCTRMNGHLVSEHAAQLREKAAAIMRVEEARDGGLRALIGLSSSL